MTVSRKNFSPGLIGLRKTMRFLPTLFVGIFYSAVLSMSSFAQNAALLPQGKQQFLDNNGNPLSSGKVFFYIPSTTTFKTTWQDAAKTVANTNPVILDAGGRAIIYGDGTYRQIVKNSANTTIFDAVTASAGTGGGTTGTGDGDLVGTVKPWAGLVAPNQYVFAYGQEISRTTYAAYFTATTLIQNINCTSASPTLTGMSDTSQIPVGAVIEATCMPAGSTVISKASTTVTMNNNASLTTATTSVFFLYGNGNGSTTFNVPDLRGYSVTGRCNMGGTNCTVIDTTQFLTNPNATGAKGGIKSIALVTSQLPPYTPAGTVGNVTAAGTVSAPTITLSAASTNVVNSGAGGSANLTGGGGALLQATITGSASAPIFTGSAVSGGSFTGTAQGGTSTPFTNISPSITLNYIVKITPDQNSADASGVTSLGLMTGDIACGSGLICTGNIIDVAGLSGSWTPSGTGGVNRTVQSTLQERGVTVTDYGAIPNDSSVGVAATNSTAFTNAFAASPNVYCPQGQNFYIAGFTIPNGAAQFSGACQLIADGAAGSDALVIVSDVTAKPLVIDGIQIAMNAGTFPALSGIRVTNSSNVTIQNTKPSGLFGVFLTGRNSAVRVIGNTFDSYYGRAVWETSSGGAAAVATISIASPGVITKVAHGLSVSNPVIFYTTAALPTPILMGQTYYVKTVLTADTFTVTDTVGGTVINTSGSQSGTQYFTDNGGSGTVISGNFVKKYLPSAHLASTALISIGGTGTIITDNRIEGTRQWGAACILGSGCIIGHNSVNGAEAEGVTVSSTVNAIMDNNTLKFDSTTQDTGISISNSDGPPAWGTSVTNNIIDGPSSGAILAGTGMKNATISGNTILNPNSGSSTINAGIALDGSTTTGNFIGPNSFGGDLSKILYQVSEASFTGGGTPSGNYIAQQLGASGATSYVNPSATTQMMVRSQSSITSTSLYNGFRFESTPLAMRDVGGTNVGLYDYDGILAFTLGSTASPTMTFGRSTYNFYTNGFSSIPMSLSGAIWTSANSAAPASPSAGSVKTWTDITDLRFHDKNSAGTVGTTVVADTGASNNFLTAISVAGVVSKAQPSFSNISGIATSAQGGTGVNNGSSTITIGGNHVLSGAFTSTFTFSNTTNSTFPSGTHTLAGLDVIQTWGAAQSFTSSNLILNGSVSGATTLNANSTGTFIATLPPATDTLVGKATTDTFTNKTYNTASTGNTFTVNGVSLDTAWTSYTPTLSCGSGTLTSAVATGFYKQVGKSVTTRIEGVITTNGTCAGRLEATLPVAVAAGAINQALSGWISSSAAVAAAGIAPGTSTTKVLMFSATGTYPGGSGVTLNAQGTYEVP